DEGGGEGRERRIWSFQSMTNPNDQITKWPDAPIRDSPMLIALGVTGGIGAYKAVEIARGLQRRGHEVVAIMTHSATRFVGPVTFEAITRRRVLTDQFEPGT